MPHQGGVSHFLLLNMNYDNILKFPYGHRVIRQKDNCIVIAFNVTSWTMKMKVLFFPFYLFILLENDFIPIKYDYYLAMNLIFLFNIKHMRWTCLNYYFPNQHLLICTIQEAICHMGSMPQNKFSYFHSNNS